MVKRFFRGIAFQVMLWAPSTQWEWLIARPWIRRLIWPPKTPVEITVIPKPKVVEVAEALESIHVQEMAGIVWHPAPPEKRVGRVIPFRNRRAR